ncbi:PucC family protein [Jannaschia aquimarina]|uniref:PUCC protein n=1 Tax=Jannaschia aquimarina TaxID=935700 RepID=A0A0D1EAX7_9RHOB|nr:PucC family protein [Jannaschia aquimarina]KIT14884.1 PUCC protein [Jannaschia aquimarina]SNS58359.1 MFS transporter, BCD family, chlorophyll transporter [Jannaschia aquimarina]
MTALRHIALRLLPFGDAGSEGLPLRQLLRLSLFQVSVGMAAVMLLGTLNRVMIVELGLSAALVATMIALPVLVAPFRALLGFRSDTHKSALGWRRLPYLWFGALWQFGGLAIMPFALLILSGYDRIHIPFVGELFAALAFVMTGLGMHMTQTAGLALAADRADDETRPRVVALLYVAFLMGMLVSAVLIGWLLRDFTPVKLIQVVQGTAVATLALNVIALWRQEGLRSLSAEERARPRPPFAEAWADLARGGTAGRLLAAVFLGTMAFAMQDVLLEPYGGEILGLSVSSTTYLTATWALGALGAFALAARWLARGMNPTRMAAAGVLAGVASFCAVIFAAPFDNAALFFAGSFGIGFGGGLFAVATLTTAMTLPVTDIAGRGLALGAWGAAQATAQGLATALGGGLRDAVDAAAMSGALGPALNDPSTGYSVVYHVEIGLLFLTLVALGPLVRRTDTTQSKEARIGLADFPT